MPVDLRESLSYKICSLRLVITRKFPEVMYFQQVSQQHSRCGVNKRSRCAPSNHSSMTMSLPFEPILVLSP